MSIENNIINSKEKVARTIILRAKDSGKELNFYNAINNLKTNNNAT